MKIRITAVTLLLLGLLLPADLTTSGAQREVNQEFAERLNQARALRASVRAAHDGFLGRTRPRLVGAYVSLSAAVRRLDAETAGLALEINTDDPEYIASLPKVEFTLQPVKLLRGRVVESLGEPTNIQLGAAGGKSPAAGGKAADFSAVISAPEGANAISVKTSIKGPGKGRHFRYILGLTAETSSGTVALSNYRPGGPAPSASGIVGASLRQASSSSLGPAAADCVEVSVSCGDCNKSAKCNVSNPDDQPDIICSCATRPCSCGDICAGGCDEHF